MYDDVTVTYLHLTRIRAFAEGDLIPMQYSYPRHITLTGHSHTENISTVTASVLDAHHADQVSL